MSASIREGNALERLRNIAARASVLAEAPGSSFIPNGEHVHDTKAPTTGNGAALLDQIKDRAKNSSNMHAVADWAERELDRRQHTPPAPKRPLKARILEDYAGMDCEAVAMLEGNVVHRTTIWRWRRDAGFDADGMENSRETR